MARIIEAKAIISGEEKLSPVLDKLAKKIDAVSKTAKNTEGIDRMAASLEKVQKEMAAIDKYSSAGGGFAKARENYRNAVRDVEAAGRAMKMGEGDAKALARAYEMAQRNVRAASRAFEAQKTAAIGAKRGLDELGISGGRIAEQQQRIAAAVDKATVAMERQQTQATRLQRIGRKVGAVGGTLGMLAGPAVLRATRAAVTAGAHFQHETDFAFPAAGIGRQETGWARDRALALSSKYPIVSPTENLKLYRETRAVISGEVDGRQNLTPQERVAIAARDTQRIFPSIVRADAALKAGGSDAGDLPLLIKGLEALGITQNVDRTQKVLDSYVRATQVAGKTIPISSVLKSIQQMMGVGGQLSDRFIESTFLSLVQEGGSRVGAGIGAMDMEFLGSMGHKQALEWKKLGFLKDDDLIYTKTGAIKGVKPGHNVAGYKLAESDPDKFMWEMVKPAIVRAGYTTLQDQIVEAQKLFGETRGRRIAAALIQQQPTYEQAAAKFNSAEGSGAADKAGRSAPGAWEELTTSLVTLGTTLTSPMMKDAATGMDMLSHAFASLGQQWAAFDKGHHRTAEVIGGGAIAAGAIGGSILSYNLLSGLMGGFGLKGSALALDGSAAALTAAAQALGGGKAVTTAVTADGGAAAAGGGIGILGSAAAGAPVAATIGTLAAVKRDSETGNTGRSWLRHAFGIDDPNEPAPWMPGGSWDSHKASPPPELHGRMEGEAKVTITIPGLGDRDVRVPLRGTFNANGPGSLGVSSPDALAPGHGGIGHR